MCARRLLGGAALIDMVSTLGTTVRHWPAGVAILK
jgi:hypothetical protein